MPQPEHEQLQTMVHAVLAIEAGESGELPTGQAIRAWVERARPVFPALTDIQAQAITERLQNIYQAWD